MRSPLTVRIYDGESSRVVTRYVRGLRFRKTAPGGHADASCRLVLANSLFTDLGPADRIFIYDGRTGQTVWEGYTNNPGTQSGRGGEGFELSALGGMSLARDRAERLVYLDTSLEQWTVDWLGKQANSATTAVGQFPEDAGSRAAKPTLFMQFTPGQPVANNAQAGMRYRGLEGSSMKLGGFAGFYDGGQIDANYEIEWHWPGTLIQDISQSTNGGGIVKYAGLDFTPGPTDTVGVRLRRVGGGATNIAAGNDNVWGAFGEVKVLGQLVDRNGANRPMATTAHVTIPVSPTFLTTEAYILASEVVEDLLGRLLTFCSPSSSVIEASTYPIDQLAYMEAATAGQVLEDLCLWEADMLYEVLESNAALKHRFNWRAWPSTARYVLPPSMRVERPGSDIDLCNRIAVNWTDTEGNRQVTIRTSVVAALGSRIRDAEPITLPEGQGSQANAERIGDQVLAAKAAAPKAGKATVDRPILDLLTGQWVQPWEIEPGYLVHLQQTDEDLRLTEVEYDDESTSATLTLGEPVLTIEQRVARLVKAS